MYRIEAVVVAQIGFDRCGKTLAHLSHHGSVGCIGRYLGCFQVALILLRTQTEHLFVTNPQPYLTARNGHYKLALCIHGRWSGQQQHKRQQNMFQKFHCKSMILQRPLPKANFKGVAKVLFTYI